MYIHDITYTITTIIHSLSKYLWRKTYTTGIRATIQTTAPTPPQTNKKNIIPLNGCAANPALKCNFAMYAKLVVMLQLGHGNAVSVWNMHGGNPNCVCVPKPRQSGFNRADVMSIADSTVMMARYCAVSPAEYTQLNLDTMLEDCCFIGFDLRLSNTPNSLRWRK